jgi:hypothetical protein
MKEGESSLRGSSLIAQTAEIFALQATPPQGLASPR